MLGASDLLGWNLGTRLRTGMCDVDFLDLSDMRSGSLLMTNRKLLPVLPPLGRSMPYSSMHVFGICPLESDGCNGKFTQMLANRLLTANNGTTLFHLAGHE